MSTPFVGFSNDTLNKQAKVKQGHMIDCDKCHGKHLLLGGMSHGEPNDTVLFYNCGGSSYLGAVAGRLVVGLKADCNGDV